MSRVHPPFPFSALAGFGFALAVVGAVAALTVFLIDDWLTWWHARTWDGVPCVMSPAASDGSPATLRYRWQGIEHESSPARIGNDRPILHSPAGAAPQTCWVDPADPAHVLIDRAYEGWWWLPVLWSVAALLLLSSVRGLREILRWACFRPDPPLTWREWAQTFHRHGAWRMTALGGAFLLPACAATWALTVLPWWNWHRAQSWSASTCVMVEGRVRHSIGRFGVRGGDVMDAAFAYQADGRQYVSHTYSPWRAGQTDWLIGAPRQVVAGRIVEGRPELALGTVHRCFVSPPPDREAYVVRDWWDGWFAIGAIGPLGMLFGLLLVMARPRHPPADAGAG